MEEYLPGLIEAWVPSLALEEKGSAASIRAGIFLVVFQMNRTLLHLSLSLLRVCNPFLPRTASQNAKQHG